MAPITKPNDKPLWATTIQLTGGRWNVIAPAPGREPEGWLYLEKPPRNYDNFLWHYTGEWIEYLEAHTDAAQKCATFVIAAEDAVDGWKQTADYVVGVGADATLVIETAIAALPAQGGRILLSDGTFTCQTTVNLGAAVVRLEGQGRSSTFLTWGNVAAGGADIVDASASPDFSIANLTIDTATVAPAYLNGLKVTGCVGTIENLGFIGIYGDGTATLPGTPKGSCLWATGSSLQVNNINIAMDSTGPDVTDAAMAFVASSVVQGGNFRILAPGFGGTNPTEAAVYLHTSNVQLHNIFAAFSTHALHAISCDNSSVSGVYGVSTGVGVHLDTCSKFNVAGVIESATGHGFFLDTCTACEVDATVLTPTAAGVSLDTCERVKVHARVDTPGTQGVEMATCERCSANACEIEAPGGSGLYIDTNSARCEIVGGSVNGSTGNGFSVLGDNCIANGVNVLTPATIGATMDGIYNQITNCRFDNIGTDGVHILSTCEDSILAECIISDVSGVNRGIYCEGQRCDVNDNKLADIVDTAITIGNAANDCNIIDNKIDVGLGAVAPAYGIHHIPAPGQGNYIQGNRCLVATTADLRIIGAYLNARSTPETAGGAGGGADGHDCRDNNLTLTAALA
jgi:hypothetical protein